MAEKKEIKKTEKKAKPVKVSERKPEKKAEKPAKVEKRAAEKSVIENKQIEASNKVLQMVPLITEKAVMLIESQNVLTFKLFRNTTKKEIKKEVEEVFDVKPIKIRVNNRGSNKYAYVKLNQKDPAIDIATKLGMI